MNQEELSPRVAEVQRIDLAQGPITYRSVGPADSTRSPVVFVHGLLVDAQLWTGVVDALAARGILSYVPNWPLGAHPIAMRSDADLSPRGIARIVIAFLESLSLTDVTLVGNDTGGAICQYVIDTDHSRIGRLVLTNCDAFEVFPPKEFDGLMKIGSHASLVKPMLAALKPTYIRHTKNVYGGTFSGEPDPRITRSWIEPGLRDGAIRRDIAKLISAIDPEDLLDVSTRFDRFDKPVRLIWGDADSFFPIDFARRLAAAFPNSTLTPVPGGRTFVPMESPDQVAQSIAEVAG